MTFADDLRSLTDEIRDALNGESNDAEHDALVKVAELLGIQWGEPTDDQIYNRHGHEGGISG